MSDRDDIRNFLADKPEKVFDRIDVITEFAHVSPASVDAALSWLAKQKHITKVGRAKYQHNPDGVVRTPGGQPQPPKAAPTKPAWLAEGLAPFQRVRLFLEANGPTKRQTLATMIANFGMDSLKRLSSMCEEGMIHGGDDDRIHLGPSPKIPKVSRHWDPRRERPLPPAKNIPVEAEAKREASAEAASEVQETVATSPLAADKSDVSAASESPAPVIVQAPATIEHPEEVMIATVTKLHAQPEVAQQESQAKVADEVMSGVEKVENEFGGGGGGISLDDRMVIFSLKTDELSIDIDGDDERALTAIRAVLASLTLSKTSAQ